MTIIDDQDEPGHEAGATSDQAQPAAGDTLPEAASAVLGQPPAEAAAVAAKADHSDAEPSAEPERDAAPERPEDDTTAPTEAGSTEVAAESAPVDKSVDESEAAAVSAPPVSGTPDSRTPVTEAGADAAFDEPVVKPAEDGGDLVLDLDGYEGPIDVLLTLARDQKVDLKKISILELADQYLAFVARARRLRLELAADYLVMAAWLAYLKSRLLLPEPPKDGEPSGAEMAAALAFQLQRLAAMQKAGQALLALPQLNRDFFRRGEPESVRLIQVPVYNLTLYELLKAYSTHPGRKREGILHIEPMRLFSMDDALHRIGDLIGQRLDWTILRDFLPDDMKFNPLQRRAALAATFAASLELVRSGRLQLRQDGTFGPIYLKAGAPRGWDYTNDTSDNNSDGNPGGGSGNEPSGETDAGQSADQDEDRDFNQGSHAR